MDFRSVEYFLNHKNLSSSSNQNIDDRVDVLSL